MTGARATTNGQPEVLHELALFAGAGGGILGGHLLGWRTICAVEREPYAAAVLLQRQNDGVLSPFPVWDDVCTFDGRPWRGRVDVVSGGFPCQDISAAGRGAGIDGERSGLWGEMARIIREVGPRFVLVENSPMLTGRGMGRVLGDLASMGFDAEWAVLGAADAGAPHLRERVWILAYTDEARLQVRVEHARRDASPGRGIIASANGWETEPVMGRVAHGVAHRVDRLGAIGNGQVPAVVALAWRTLIAQAEAVCASISG